VGSFAVQFAKQAEAHVIATASSANHALVKELGADELIDYRREDFALRAGDVDLVIDTVGGATLERSWQAIKPGGRLVTLVDPTVRGRDGIQGSFLFFTHEAALLQDILRRFENRRLQVILDTIHPLDEARAALAQVAAGHARGKVIVRPPR
jgi:NADPH:quinone reductase-like Zn-dependent oxidoreductase